jgi:hypothetical protein
MKQDPLSLLPQIDISELAEIESILLNVLKMQVWI